MVRLPKGNSDYNAYICLNDYMRTLLGGHEWFDIQLNANNPPTVKRYSRFSVYATDASYTIPTSPATGNSEYIAGNTPTYLLSEGIFEDSADQTFAWGAGNFPASSNDTWYLHCRGGIDTDATTIGKGEYGASTTETPTWSAQKGGYYSASGYRVLAKFTVAAGVVGGLEIYHNSYPNNYTTAKSSSFNVDINVDTYIVTGTTTATLPAASTAINKRVTFIHNDANVMTIDGNGSETINGALTLLTAIHYDVVTLHCNGIEWFRIS